MRGRFSRATLGRTMTGQCPYYWSHLGKLVFGAWSFWACLLKQAHLCVLHNTVWKHRSRATQTHVWHNPLPTSAPKSPSWSGATPRTPGAPSAHTVPRAQRSLTNAAASFQSSKWEIWTLKGKSWGESRQWLLASRPSTCDCSQVEITRTDRSALPGAPRSRGAQTRGRATGELQPRLRAADRDTPVTRPGPLPPPLRTARPLRHEGEGGPASQPADRLVANRVGPP